MNLEQNQDLGCYMSGSRIRNHGRICHGLQQRQQDGPLLLSCRSYRSLVVNLSDGELNLVIVNECRPQGMLPFPEHANVSWSSFFF